MLGSKAHSSPPLMGGGSHAGSKAHSSPPLMGGGNHAE